MKLLDSHQNTNLIRSINFMCGETDTTGDISTRQDDFRVLYARCEALVRDKWRELEAERLGQIASLVTSRSSSDKVSAARLVSMSAAADRVALKEAAKPPAKESAKAFGVDFVPAKEERTPQDIAAANSMYDRLVTLLKSPRWVAQPEMNFFIDQTGIVSFRSFGPDKANVWISGNPVFSLFSEEQKKALAKACYTLATGHNGGEHRTTALRAVTDHLARVS